MELKRLSGLLLEAVIQGADSALSASGQLADTLTKAQAYRLYGRVNVDRWLKEGLIHAVSAGSGKKKFIDRLKLEAVARASNRATYLQVAER